MAERAQIPSAWLMSAGSGAKTLDETPDSPKPTPLQYPQTLAGAGGGGVTGSAVYSDSWQGYNALDVSSFKHYRINHSALFADAHNHINGIENFWNQAKRHMRKFNAVPKEHFGLFLKGCEWRFNNPDPKRQLSQLKQWLRNNMG